MSDPNPQNLTFPYPQMGTVKRPNGQGCTSCINSLICPAVYWLKRCDFYSLQPSNGIQCASWDTDPAHMIVTPAAADVAENNYMYVQDIQSEPSRNGLTAPVTASQYDR